MAEAERFTTEWWRELFKKGKPMGYGGVELRDEDKYLWVLQLQRWYFGLADAVKEKYGEEGAQLVAEVFVKEAGATWKLLIDALGVEPEDIADIVGILASFDANLGSDVEIRNVSQDRTSAEFTCKNCTTFESGMSTKESCQNVMPLMGMALASALGPLAEQIDVAEADIDPPRHCKTVLKKKEA